MYRRANAKELAWLEANNFQHLGVYCKGDIRLRTLGWSEEDDPCWEAQVTVQGHEYFKDGETPSAAIEALRAELEQTIEALRDAAKSLQM